MHELKAMIEEIGKAADDFRVKYDARLDQIETAVARGQFTGGSSFTGGGAHQRAEAREHEQAFMAWARRGDTGTLRDLEIQAGLSTYSDPDGGYAVPMTILDGIEKQEQESVTLRRLATVLQVRGDIRKLVTVGAPAAGWVGENEVRTETDSPTLAAVEPPMCTVYANPAATQEVLDDAGFSLERWFIDEISEAFGSVEGEAFILGNGVKAPKGILSYATSTDVDGTRPWNTVQYVAGGHATLLSNADKLYSVVHSLNPKYWAGASWIMNPNTLEKIRTFKDGDGNYLWKPGLEQAQPDRLLGFPVYLDSFMHDIGAGKFPVAFGNWPRAYLIGDHLSGLRLLRDPYSTKGKVFFYTTKRTSGAVQNHAAYKLLKIAAS